MLLLTAIIVTLAAVAVGVISTQKSTVELNVDGKTQTVSLTGEDKTVKDALVAADVDLDNSVIYPAPGAPLKDGSVIAVRYQKPFEAIVDGVRVEQITTAVTLDEALVAAGESPNPGAYVSEDLTEYIPVTGLTETVVVSNPKRITLVAAGRKRQFKTNAVTVGEVLEDKQIKVDNNDELSKDLDTYTQAGLKISLVKVRVVEKQVKKNVELPTIVKTTSALDEGETKVVSIGQPKVLKYNMRLVYKNGKLTKEKTVRKTVVSRGSARVIRKGTAPVYAETPPGGSCAGWGTLLDKYFGADSSTACRVMLCESGGNPRAQNPVSSASGLFQFIDGTWASARTAVPGGSNYSRALYAPAELQIQAAAAWKNRTSWTQWSCY